MLPPDANSPVVVTSTSSGGLFTYIPDQHRLSQHGKPFAMRQAPALAAPGSHRLMDRTVTALWIGVTRSCNLRCSYCFTPPTLGTPLRMHFDTARQCVDFLLKEGLRDPEHRPRRLIFFGGEPLLNFELIEQAVYYAEARARVLPVEFEYSISTNGTLIGQEHARFFSDHRFEVQVSLDGPAEVHNRFRLNGSNEGSYADTLNGLSKLLDVQGSFRLVVRPTVSNHSPDLVDLARFLFRLGIRKVFVKPLSTARDDSSPPFLAWLSRQWDQIDELVGLVSSAYRAGFILHPFVKQASDVTQGRHPIFHCGAGSCALSIEPDGSVFPCHKFRDWAAERFSGSLATLPDTARQPYLHLSVDSLEPCRVCWARWFCGGCCPAESRSRGLPLAAPNEAWCAFRRFEASVSLGVAATMAEGGIWGQKRPRAWNPEDGSDATSSRCR